LLEKNVFVPAEVKANLSTNSNWQPKNTIEEGQTKKKKKKMKGARKGASKENGKPTYL
jgi:hypothetical protein